MKVENKKIFIIEDEEKIRVELSEFLNRYGYEVSYSTNFENIVNIALKENPHVILLDINLPYYDGYYICREIRKNSNVPIIVVTSRNSEIDELMSMNLGADDFITKPYNTQILLARVASVLKRAYPNEKITDNIEHNGITLNILTNTIQYNDKSVELTKNEFKILHYLLINRGKIVSRVDILDYLWDSALFVNDNTLTVNITRIRNKMEELGIKDYIKTKRGQGYMI